MRVFAQRHPVAALAAMASVVLLALAGISLAATSAISLAAIVDPRVPFVLTAAGVGLVLLFLGLVGWRVSVHRAALPPEPLSRLVCVAVLLASALIASAVAAAWTLSLLPADPRYRVTSAALVASALVTGVGAVAGLTAARRASDSGALVGRWRRTVSWVARRGELIGVAIAVALLALPVLRFISLGQLLGFDESIYAATARSWILGTPNTAWLPYRSPGISLLGLPFAWAESDAGLRLIGAAFGLGAVVAGWGLARRVAGPAAGVLAALLIGTVPALQLNSGLFLTDVPALTVLLVLMLVMWGQFEERARPDRGLLWLAPLIAASFYLRYGSSVPVALITLTAFLLWWRQLLAAWRLALATAALLLLLLLPHLVHSTLEGGTPWAIALFAQARAGAPDSPGAALRDYIGMLPVRLAGLVGGGVCVLGLTAWPIRLVARRLTVRSSRAHTFLVLPAIGQVVVLGLVAHAEARFVLLPVALLLIAGSATLVELGARLNAPWRRSLAMGLLIAIAVGGITSAAAMMRVQAEVTPDAEVLADAGRAIRDDAAGRSCSILGYPPPELIWYSRCEALHFGLPPTGGRESLLTGERRYLMLTTLPTEREPQGSLREAYLALADPEPIATLVNRVTGRPYYEVYLIHAD